MSACLLVKKMYVMYIRNWPDTGETIIFSALSEPCAGCVLVRLAARDLELLFIRRVFSRF